MNYIFCSVIVGAKQKTRIQENMQYWKTAKLIYLFHELYQTWVIQF